MNFWGSLKLLLILYSCLSGGAFVFGAEQDSHLSCVSTLASAAEALPQVSIQDAIIEAGQWLYEDPIFSNGNFLQAASEVYTSRYSSKIMKNPIERVQFIESILSTYIEHQRKYHAHLNGDTNSPFPEGYVIPESPEIMSAAEKGDYKRLKGLVDHRLAEISRHKEVIAKVLDQNFNRFIKALKIWRLYVKFKSPRKNSWGQKLKPVAGVVSQVVFAGIAYVFTQGLHSYTPLLFYLGFSGGYYWSRYKISQISNEQVRNFLGRVITPSSQLSRWESTFKPLAEDSAPKIAELQTSSEKWDTQLTELRKRFEGGEVDSSQITTELVDLLGQASEILLEFNGLFMPFYNYTQYLSDGFLENAKLNSYSDKQNSVAVTLSFENKQLLNRVIAINDELLPYYNYLLRFREGAVWLQQAISAEISRLEKSEKEFSPVDFQQLMRRLNWALLSSNTLEMNLFQLTFYGGGYDNELISALREAQISGVLHLSVRSNTTSSEKKSLPGEFLGEK